MPGGSLLRGENRSRGRLPLPRGHLLGGNGTERKLSVPDVHAWALLSGGLRGSNELPAGDVPAVHGRDGRGRVPGLRGGVGMRVRRHVCHDHAVSFVFSLFLEEELGKVRVRGFEKAKCVKLRV